MGKFIGTTGLSRLWSKFKNNMYVFKTDENAGSSPDTTYSYTLSSAPTKQITVDIYTTASTSSVTLICTLSEPVDVNLLFQLRYVSQNTKRWFTVMAGKTNVEITEPDSALNQTYGRLSNMSEATLVGADKLEGNGYSFTINTHWNVGSTYKHTVTLENAQVDWHTMTVSGKLTRSTTAANNNKPQINTYIGINRRLEGNVWSDYITTAQSTIAANSNITTISNLPITELGTDDWSDVVPVNTVFSTSQTQHYIECLSRSYTSLDSNIGITISNWAQTSLRPTLYYFKSSAESVYSGTLPSLVCSVTNLIPGDRVIIYLYAYFGSYNNIPYTVFGHTASWSGSGTTMSFPFHTIDINYYDIQDGTVATTYLYMDAYWYNPNVDMQYHYIGSWPTSSSETGITGSFARSTLGYAPPTSQHYKSTNTTLFGNVTLERKFW